MSDTDPEPPLSPGETLLPSDIEYKRCEINADNAASVSTITAQVISSAPISSFEPGSFLFNVIEMSNQTYQYGAFGPWEPVDNFTTSHLDARLKPSLSEGLAHAVKKSEEGGLPDIAVSRPQGKFLMLQARLANAKHVVEVGTLGGYSSIWFAHASPDIKVTTIEVNEHHATVARENLKFAGVDDRVEVIVGSGVDVLTKLVEEINLGKRERFDLAFIDADKENNWTYFDYVANISTPGACLIVDNVVRQGSLADAEFAKTNSRAAGCRLLVENVGKDERADAVVMQTVGGKSYDGFLLAVVRDDISDYLKNKGA